MDTGLPREAARSNVQENIILEVCPSAKRPHLPPRRTGPDSIERLIERQMAF